MPRPEQPEVERSGHTDVDPDHADEVAGAGSASATPAEGKGPEVPVPPANRPGHHAAVEQDKLQGPPPRPSASTTSAERQRFPFLFDIRLTPAAAAFGVLPPIAYVELDEGDLFIRFGPWSLRTPRTNVATAEVTSGGVRPITLARAVG